jgi:5-methyltetrahydropteroyltriglutamate--homocysteine methyltransferase
MPDPFRADVVGSLLRPDYLKSARVEWEAERMPTPEFKRLEDRAVQEVVALQEDCGLDVINDGEMRRFIYTGSFTEVVEGISFAPSGTLHWFGEKPEDDFDFQNRLSVTSKLRRRRSMANEEYSFTRALTDLPVKVTLPSPLVLVNWWNPEHSTAVYGDLFEAMEAAAEILREEIVDLVAMGCPYIQIDAPEVAVLVDQRQHDYYRSQGIEPERFLTDGIDLCNSLVVEGETTYGFHLCRGNNVGYWMAAGGYETISKQVFSRLPDYDRFLLEYDSPRAGSLDAIADVPDDKVVVLGLISTKKSELESIDALLERVDQAARVFPRDQLAVSTQCGFASSSLGNPISVETERAKLALVAEVARRGWEA